MVRESFFDGRYSRRCLSEGEEGGVLGKGNSTYKGFEVGISLMGLSVSKKVYRCSVEVKMS